MIRIALAQINTTVGDLDGNYRKIAAGIKKAKIKKSDIVVFPELAVTGYPPEDLLFKDHFVADNMAVLKKITRLARGIVVVVGFVDQNGNKELYNAAAVLAGGRIKGIYHKQALPNYGVFDEKRYFTAGNGNPIFKIGGIPLAVNICEDIWIEEGVFKKQMKAGVKIILNISSSPYDFGKIEQRERILADRAKKNKTTICYVNNVGGQDELVFDGGSLVVNPKGETISSGKQFEEDMIYVDIPENASKKKKKASCITLPRTLSCGQRKSISPRVAPCLSQTEGVCRALILGTRDYLKKNGFQKAVIGLSGGIDSSLVAAIAKEAIGPDNVIGITMPSRFTSRGTKSDAKQLAANLGIRIIEIPIGAVMKAYVDVLKPDFAGRKSDVTEENLQARIRGNLLMAFSNKFDWLVLTTGNKSEIAVGYCTLYGDMSGGFAVIKDVPKTMVYKIAKLINDKSGDVIPRGILDRAPTAELRRGQKDQDSLPPYDFLDALIKDYVEDHRSFRQMSGKRKKASLIKDIIRMIDRSEYKRRQAPPGIKITPRAFGKDWRLPITNKYKGF